MSVPRPMVYDRRRAPLARDTDAARRDAALNLHDRRREHDIYTTYTLNPLGQYELIGPRTEADRTVSAGIGVG